MFKITMSTHKSTAINFVARASRRNRDCVATHLFTFLNHFNLWTLTSACDALATCYLYVNTLREHEQQVHTRIKHRTLHTERTRALQSSIPASYQYSVELVHFIQIWTWPNSLSVSLQNQTDRRNTEQKNYLEQRKRQSIFFGPKKTISRRKQNFFNLFANTNKELNKIQ